MALPQLEDTVPGSEVFCKTTLFSRAYSCLPVLIHVGIWSVNKGSLNLFHRCRLVQMDMGLPLTTMALFCSIQPLTKR